METIPTTPPNNIPITNPDPQTTIPQNPIENPIQKPKSKKFIVVAIVVFALIILSVASTIYFYTIRNSNKNETTTKQTSSGQKQVNPQNLPADKLNTDLLALKMQAGFKLYIPTYIPKGYTYENTIVSEEKNNNGDQKSTKVITSTFKSSADTIEMRQSGLKLNQKEFEEMLEPPGSTINHSGPEGEIFEKISTPLGEGVYVYEVYGTRKPGGVVVLNVKNNSTILFDSHFIDKDESLKIANSFIELK